MNYEAGTILKICRMHDKGEPNETNVIGTKAIMPITFLSVA
jgi:hypothetical protein